MGDGAAQDRSCHHVTGSLRITLRRQRHGFISDRLYGQGGAFRASDANGTVLEAIDKGGRRIWGCGSDYQSSCRQSWWMSFAKDSTKPIGGNIIAHASTTRLRL